MEEEVRVWPRNSRPALCSGGERQIFWSQREGRGLYAARCAWWCAEQALLFRWARCTAQAAVPARKLGRRPPVRGRLEPNKFSLIKKKNSHHVRLLGPVDAGTVTGQGAGRGGGFPAGAGRGGGPQGGGGAREGEGHVEGERAKEGEGGKRCVMRIKKKRTTCPSKLNRCPLFWRSQQQTSCLAVELCVGDGFAAPNTISLHKTLSLPRRGLAPTHIRPHIIFQSFHQAAFGSNPSATPFMQ